MKKQTIIKAGGVLLFGLVILITRNTDVMYVGSAILFFAICVAYAEWCERL